MSTKRKRRGISRRERREIRERREADERGRSVRRARETQRTEKRERDFADRLAESRPVTAAELLDRSGNYWRYGHRRATRARRLVEIVLERRPRLTDRQTVRLLWALTEVHWVRAAESWRPAGRGAWQGLRSLIDHLLVRYPVPPFLYGALLEEATRADSNGSVVRFFSCAGAGVSIRPKARELFGVPLTRRMTAILTGTPKGYAMYPAIRRAQLLAFGGAEATARAVSATRLGRGMMIDEEYWGTILHWLCRQDDLDPPEIGPLVDYFFRCRMEIPTYEIAGRSLKKVREAMEAWHRELARTEKLRVRAYAPSGFAGGIWEGRASRPNERPSLWTVEEILDSKDLEKEGRYMRHCVAAFGGLIEKGVRSIWSLRRDDVRRVTVEVENRGRRILQARGRWNAMPKRADLNYLRRWARENGLTMADYL